MNDAPAGTVEEEKAHGGEAKADGFQWMIDNICSMYLCFLRNSRARLREQARRLFACKGTKKN